MPENIESFSHTETPLQFQIRAYEILQERFAELQQANKALSLQNEVLSGAYETSQKREKDLMAEKEELLAALIRAEHEIKHAYNGAPNFAVITKAKIRAAIEKSQGIFNPADLDEI